MLDKHDIGILRGMFKENNEALRRDLRRELSDEVHGLITASERRMITRMDAMEHRIITNIAEFMDTSVFPRIDALESDMSVAKAKLRIA